MDPAVSHVIEAIHQSPFQCVLATTGGGAGAVAELLNVPGGSRTLLEDVVPYGEQAFVEFLGCRPEQFCSEQTAREMAERAFERACWLAPRHAVVGLGCTASLATDRPKRGDHRFHVATRTDESSRLYSLVLMKGARDREGEEAVLDGVLLNALAEAFGCSERVDAALLPGEKLLSDTSASDNALTRFLRGEIPTICQEVDGRICANAPPPKLLLPGAFNPIHAGHRQLAAVAARLTGLDPAYELSVVNVDKPSLAAEEIRHRLPQFAWHAPIWLTRAPTFADKARLFPGATFVVGVDTAARIVSPRYYDDSSQSMKDALKNLRNCDCRFLVAGRVDATGKFVQLSELELPTTFSDLFQPIRPEHFRLDLSSTELRKQATHEPVYQ